MDAIYRIFLIQYLSRENLQLEIIIHQAEIIFLSNSFVGKLIHVNYFNFF